jgi:hypothetical protein
LVHRTARTTVLGAVAIAAAFGLGGCGQDSGDATAPVVTPATISAPPTAAAPFGPSSTDPPAPMAPLPPPTALTDVMSRLADPAIPGADKVDLVESATADDAAALDRFGRALSDSGFTPLTFEAHDMVWGTTDPGNVVANISIKTANPQAGDFSFPMEFSPADGSWQLTRQTADILLQLGQAQTPPG